MIMMTKKRIGMNLLLGYIQIFETNFTFTAWSVAADVYVKKIITKIMVATIWSTNDQNLAFARMLTGTIKYAQCCVQRFSLLIFSTFSPFFVWWASSRFCQRINLEFSNSSFLHSRKFLKMYSLGLWNISSRAVSRRDSDGFQIHQKSNVSSKPGLSKTFASYLTHE